MPRTPPLWLTHIQHIVNSTREREENEWGVNLSVNTGLWGSDQSEGPSNSEKDKYKDKDKDKDKDKSVS